MHGLLQATSAYHGRFWYKVRSMKDGETRSETTILQ